MAGRRHLWTASLVLVQLGCLEIVEREDDPLPPAVACDPTKVDVDVETGVSFDAAAGPCVELEMEPSDFEKLSKSHRFPGEDPFRQALKALTESCTKPFPSGYPMFEAKLNTGSASLSRVGVRKKGFLGSVTGSGMLKPSLRIKTDEFVKGQNLGSEERITLNNNADDPSHVRTCLAYDVFRSAGYPAPRCNLAGVMVNGKALGPYTHIEALKKRFLRFQFGNDSGSLYEGTVADFRPDFFQDGTLGRWEAKTGDTDPDGAPLIAIQAALGAPDAELLDTLEPLLDVDRFITYWALEMLIDHRDGYAGNRNNFFVYFDPSNGGRAVFVPWGADDVMRDGQDGSAPRGPKDYLFAELPRRLSQLSDVRERFELEMNRLLETAWNEEDLLARLQVHAEQVRPLQKAPGYDEDIRVLTAWIQNRRSRVEALLAGGLPAGDTSAPSCFTIGLADGLAAVQEAADLVGTYNFVW